MYPNQLAVIFDGDDTLWRTQPIYKSVIDEFYAVLEQQGFAPEVFRPLFTSINQDLLKKIELSRDRLGRAMSGTYETMCQHAGIMSQSSISERLVELAQQVYIRTPEPVEHVHEVLSLLQKDFELFFYSGGVEETQKARLAKLGLDHYFQDRVFVVTRKDAKTLEGILQTCSLDPEVAWMVGNSPKFDVNPALQVGLNCVWLHTSFWKEELVDIGVGRVFGAFSLDEVANVLLYGNGFGPQGYVPSTQEVQEIQAALLRETETENVWVVGTSPKLDINPALSIEANPVWIPTVFDANDVEPFSGSMFVAFSPEGARQIIGRWSGSNLDLTKVIWRLREKRGNLGGSLVVD
jgi:putative hydrolase of the HAD superfamily